MKRLYWFAVLLLLIGLPPTHASTIAYLDPAGQGTQAWGGNLGLTFDVLSPINVTALGVFNASGTGFIAGTIQVVIYNMTAAAQVTPVVTFHGTYTPVAFDVFQSITPVLLGPGSYEVVAVGFSGADRNGNLSLGSSNGPTLNDGGGLIAFTGATWDSSASLDGPLTCVGCQSTPDQWRQFDAGTFQFNAVPEPPTYGLVGCCFVVLSGILRRRLSR